MKKWQLLGLVCQVTKCSGSCAARICIHFPTHPLCFLANSDTAALQFVDLSALPKNTGLRNWLGNHRMKKFRALVKKFEPLG